MAGWETAFKHVPRRIPIEHIRTMGNIEFQVLLNSIQPTATTILLQSRRGWRGTFQLIFFVFENDIWYCKLPPNQFSELTPAFMTDSQGASGLPKADDSTVPIDEWILMRVGTIPKNSIGCFRCGVGFYNKREFARSIECFQKSVEMDPLNVSSWIKRLCGMTLTP